MCDSNFASSGRRTSDQNLASKTSELGERKKRNIANQSQIRRAYICAGSISLKLDTLGKFLEYRSSNALSPFVKGRMY
jgi:hypothetical protein